jgi:hypothetical protein
VSEALTPDQQLDCARRVLEAGFWLIEHGYGRMRVLPYQYATGHWRCEFHVADHPSQTVFRYSEAQGRRYLSNHCGGSISVNVSAQKLAEAILVSVPEAMREACSGPVATEVAHWLAQVRDVLDAGSIPSAFGEFYGRADQRWRLLALLPGAPDADTLPPIPGFVVPGEEKSPQTFAPWRDGTRRLADAARSGGISLSPSIIEDENRLFDVAAQLSVALSSGTAWDRAPLLRAAIGVLQCSVDRSDSISIIEPGEISLAPSKDPIVRRGARLLSMVHELHKAGYQHLRVACGEPRSGLWRVRLLPAQDVADDGWSPLITDDRVDYDTDVGAAWFDWTDAAEDDARALARKFIERFPRVAQASIGEDWAYAGWFTRVLGRAECGQLPLLFGSRVTLEGEDLPPAPICARRTAADLSPTGYSLISHTALRADDLPPRGAEYEQLWQFCLSHDGYHGGLLSAEDCFRISDEVARTERLEDARMDALRTAAFILQRRLSSYGEFQVIHRDHPDMQAIHRIIEALRDMLAG